MQIIHSARPKQLPDAHSARKSAPDPSPGRHCAAASIKSFCLRICATTKAGQDKELLSNTFDECVFFCLNSILVQTYLYQTVHLTVVIGVKILDIQDA